MSDPATDFSLALVTTWASQSDDSARSPNLADLLALPQSLGELSDSQEPDGEGRRAQLLDAIIQLVAAERAFLIEYNEAASEWQVLAARSFECEDVLNPSDKVIVPLLETARERQEGFFTEDLTGERIFEQLQRQRQPRCQSLWLLPVPSTSQFLYVDHRFSTLEVPAQRGWELACLFSVLCHTESNARSRAELAELDKELRDLRKQLRERRGPKADDGAGSNARPAVARSDPRGFDADFSNVIGRSPDLLEILEVIEKVAPTTAPVLINGESGTGKELIAQAIHNNSDRAGNAYISENCAALTETLLESELFGYVKGAFTGATEDRAGLFELATGGTLFLDEVGDTSPGMQKKLLRALQEGVVRRVGGADLIPVDVRVIAATNKDLHAEVRSGAFREDLFYRLNVINIELPPLRERRQDIPLLLEHFLEMLRSQSGQAKRASLEFEESLTSYHWPGNIRELQNEIRRAFALSDATLDASHLSPAVRESSRGGMTPGANPMQLDNVLELGSLKEATEALEKQILASSLARYQGNKAKVCQKLKIPKTTLYAKLKRYELE